MSTIINPSSSGGGAPSGSAGGDLGGTYPNPEVVSVANDAIAFTTAGHIIPKTTAPTVGSFASGLEVTSSTVTGSDTSFIVNFTTGTVSSAATTNLFTVTLNTGYSNSEYTVMMAPGNSNTLKAVQEADGGFGFLIGAYPTASNTILMTIAGGGPQASSIFSSDVTYSFAFITMGAGATS
jgi:hypothetical protein